MTDQEAATDLSAIWAELEGVELEGRSYRRLSSDLDLRATIDLPQRTLGLQLKLDELVSFEPTELAGSKEIGITCLTNPSSGTDISLTLKHRDSRDMFLRLADDLVRRVVSEHAPKMAAIVLVRRFNAWQRFLRRSGRGLSPERQRGLLGELKILRDLILPALKHQAVGAWTGPSGAPQDFQTSSIAIEVKTIVHSEPQRLIIDGERQLDDNGLAALVLAHHRVLQHQDSGETLVDLVESLRREVTSTGGSIDELDDKLFEYGYVEAERDLYSGHGYSHRDTQYYWVRPGFPRITEADLAPGIGQLRYSIDASACVPFAIDEEAVGSWLREPPMAHVEGAESDQVEFKQTAWTPTQEGTNPEHTAALVAAVKTGVVKSVAALLNSLGGELVIGVEDAGHRVTGIEADMASGAGLDIDEYERILLTLLANQIDNRISAQVRVRFESHGDATTCHVAVRPSPVPRFARPVAGPGVQPRAVFWIRRGNSTVELEGNDMQAYISEHWS